MRYQKSRRRKCAKCGEPIYADYHLRHRVDFIFNQQWFLSNNSLFLSWQLSKAWACISHICHSAENFSPNNRVVWSQWSLYFSAELVIWTKVRRDQIAGSVSPQSLESSSSAPEFHSDKWHRVSVGSFGWCLGKSLVGTSLSVYQSFWRAKVKSTQIHSTCWGVTAQALPGISI